MDPQKLPDANRPTPTNNPPSPTDAANDISMSGESGVAPGTVVVGGQNSQTPVDSLASDSAPTDVPAPSSDTFTAPNPVGNTGTDPMSEPEPQMAAFMRGDAPADVPPAPKKKMGLIIGIIVAILLLLGGGVAAYFMYLKPNPEKILKTALANTFSSKVTSVGFEGGLVIADPESSVDMSLTFNGAASQNGQFDLSATFTVSAVEPVTLNMLSVDGKDFYAKVGGLEGIAALLGVGPTTANYVPLLQTIDDQWYQIGEETVSQFAGNTMPTSTVTLSDADRQKLADAYTQNEFLTVTETLNDEKVAGVDSYHYKVTVDETKLKSFLTAIEASNVDMTGAGLTQPLLTSLKNSIDNSNLASTPVDVWIAKDSKLFTQFAFSTTVDGVDMDVELTLQDYNKLVSVEVPEGAKPITELLAPFLSLGIQ